MPITLTRSLLVVLIPGGILITPFMVILYFANQNIAVLYKDYVLLFNAFFFTFSVIAGLILEGVVSFQEKRWDEDRNDEYQVYENWYNFLAKETANEPVGFRYISRLVTTMYFELAMMVAVPVFGFGIMLNIERIVTNYICGWAIFILLITFGLGWYFRFQAKSTHLVLCKTRMEILKRMEKPG